MYEICFFFRHNSREVQEGRDGQHEQGDLWPRREAWSRKPDLNPQQFNRLILLNLISIQSSLTDLYFIILFIIYRANSFKPDLDPQQLNRLIF